MAARANPLFALVLGATWALAASTGCDKDEPSHGSPEAAASGSTVIPTPTASAPPEPAPAPDIVVDGANVSVGTDRVPTGELGLADKVAVFLRGKPRIEGQPVKMVALRNAKPSSVVAVVTALRKAGAASAVVRTDARDGTTQSMPVSFAPSVADCATVAWIAKDAAIDVWPAGGGTAKRVLKGLAGPDMTLGLEAMRKQWQGCGAQELVVGAEDVMTWGLVFDLGTTGLQAPGARASTVVLPAAAVPGRKLTLP